VIDRLLACYRDENRELRANEPHGLIEHARDVCRFRSKPLELPSRRSTCPGLATAAARFPKGGTRTITQRALSLHRLAHPVEKLLCRFVLQPAVVAVPRELFPFSRQTAYKYRNRES
jgi:hypothetical protein